MTIEFKSNMETITTSYKEVDYTFVTIVEEDYVIFYDYEHRIGTHVSKNEPFLTAYSRLREAVELHAIAMEYM